MAQNCRLHGKNLPRLIHVAKVRKHPSSYSSVCAAFTATFYAGVNDKADSEATDSLDSRHRAVRDRAMRRPGLIMGTANFPIKRQNGKLTSFF